MWGRNLGVFRGNRLSVCHCELKPEDQCVRTKFPRCVKWSRLSLSCQWKYWGPGRFPPSKNRARGYFCRVGLGRQYREVMQGNRSLENFARAVSHPRDQGRPSNSAGLVSDVPPSQAWGASTHVIFVRLWEQKPKAQRFRMAFFLRAPGCQ